MRRSPTSLSPEISLISSICVSFWGRFFRPAGNDRSAVLKSELHDGRWYSTEKDTMKASDKTKPATCPAQRTLDVIGGRWKVPIVYHLFERTWRFSELRRALPGCTQKMLTQQLRELERDGVVRRKVFAQVPPKVEYSLTEMGRSLRPVIKAMCKWGGDSCGGKR